MATKFSKFNQFNSFIPMALSFYHGMLIGCVLSDKYDRDWASEFGRFIVERVNTFGFDLDDDSVYFGVIHDGVYNFIVVYADEEDMDASRSITLSTMIQVAKMDVELYTTSEEYYPYNRMITSSVEEKNVLQSMFAVMGWSLFDDNIKQAFRYDPFFHAFEKACLQYNGGRQYAMIPDANTIFEVYKKCLKRWHIPKKEGEA